jgi:OOP family OmpA-OmpF porin
MTRITRMFLLSILAAFFMLHGTIAAGQDETSKPIPYFSGMPNYEIGDAASSDKEFDEYSFFDGKNAVKVEGKKWLRYYALKEDAKQASELQITRNYANAIRSMGGTVLFEGVCENEKCGNATDRRAVTGKVTKGSKELWVEVYVMNDGNDYNITVVEKEAMKQVVTANDMLQALKTEGHIALYINFDTGKSTIKPESKPIVDQIVQMLKSSPDLKLNVEGHTDNVGNPKSNKTLSEERAKSVIAEIIKQGVDAKRLSPVGFGQDKPIADNKTEEGKAKNRRVELVKK